MSDEPDNLVLRYLRRLDDKVDRVLDDVSDLKVRIGTVERQVHDLRGDVLNVSNRLDRMDLRLDRIDRRLDLADHKV